MIVLSVVPFNVNPPKLAFASAAPTTSLIVILLSSTTTVFTSNCVVLPEITKFPSIFKFLIELFAIHFTLIRCFNCIYRISKRKPPDHAGGLNTFTNIKLIIL